MRNTCLLLAGFATALEFREFRGHNTQLTNLVSVFSNWVGCRRRRGQARERRAEAGILRPDVESTGHQGTQLCLWRLLLHLER